MLTRVSSQFRQLLRIRGKSPKTQHWRGLHPILMDFWVFHPSGGGVGHGESKHPCGFRGICAGSTAFLGSTVSVQSVGISSNPPFNMEIMFEPKKELTGALKRMTAPIKLKWRHIFLIAAMAAYVAMARLSGMHLDLARDARVAFDIIDGQSYPLLGPLLAGQVRLGAGWYYLLAALYGLAGSWLGTLVLLFLMGSLQFPLAYLAGKAWCDRRTGLIWAALLLLPSWRLFELVLPTHTLLTAPLTLATLLAVLRFWRGGQDKKYFYTAVLFFSLALHAHPTALVLFFPVIAIFLYLLVNYQKRFNLIGLSLVCGLVPFASLVVYQVSSGFNIDTMVGNYIGQLPWSRDWRRFFELMWQISGGGFFYWVSSISELSSGIVIFLSLVFNLIMALGFGGFLFLRLSRSAGNRWALLFMVAAAIATFLIRDYYPYYMLTVVHVIFLGFVAAGLTDLFCKRTFPILALLAMCFASFVAVIFQVSYFQKNGNWNISIIPLFDVVGKNYEPDSLVLMPAYAVSKGSRWFCGQGALAAHGPLAIHLLQDYALEFRLGCRDHALVLGGNDPAKAHWIGLSHAMAEHAGLKNGQSIGPLRVWSARPLMGHQIEKVMQLDYPPVSANNLPTQTTKFDLEVKSGEHLAITHFGLFFMPAPELSIESSGRVLKPIARDWMTRLYYCADCVSGVWTVELKASRPDLIDIVTF